jgi:hypothetical protein
MSMYFVYTFGKKLQKNVTIYVLCIQTLNRIYFVASFSTPNVTSQ